MVKWYMARKNPSICNWFFRFHTSYDNINTAISKSRLVLFRKSYIYIPKKSTKSRIITPAYGRFHVYSKSYISQKYKAQKTNKCWLCIQEQSQALKQVSVLWDFDMDESLNAWFLYGQVLNWIWWLNFKFQSL